ncbi:MAG TPA: hypothetical protein DDX54_03835 [Rhodospirillaceae bacterium]|jgi:hypothetical protein|nr:toll/interleukin-1 receptor domain-containing protein [Alphaproteobacteria bacterium]HBH26514.1 hypothetical protein [Rhodospirillaceae bacterium]
MTKEVKEYYISEMQNYLCISRDLTSELHYKDGNILKYNITASRCFDRDMHSFFYAFYIPILKNEDEFIYICADIEQFIKIIDESASNVKIRLNRSGDTVNIHRSEDASNTRVCKIYTDQKISESIKKYMRESGQKKGIILYIYDKIIVDSHTKTLNPIGFICHDAKDKDIFVKDLVLQLSRKMCPVWYDEFSIRPGDDIRKKIDEGIKKSKKCVIIISKNLIDNTRWADREVGCILEKEMKERKTVIIPVWLNVSHNEVYDYDAFLSGKRAIVHDGNIEQTAERVKISLMV